MPGNPDKINARLPMVGAAAELGGYSMAKARYKKDARGFYHTSVALPNGRRKHIAAKTIAELERKKADAAVKPLDTGMCLRDYALKWFATYQASHAYKTREMYARIVDSFICDPDIGIGHVPMGALRPMVVQEFILRIRNDGRGHSMRRTCEQAVITLRQIEKAAVRDGVITQQFTYGVTLEREPKQEKKRALTPEEEAAVFSCSLPAREKAAVMILYGCGLRRGELLALKREDIDLEGRKLSVRRGVVFVGNNPLVQPMPKTASGIRTVPIPISAVPTIGAYLRLEQPAGWIFPGKGQLPMTLGAWRYMWKKIMEAMQEAGASCEGLTPHCFRHNYATRMYYSSLTPMMAAKLMGHADTSMIERVYAHLREEQEEVVAKIDQAFPELGAGGDRMPVRLVR